MIRVGTPHKPRSAAARSRTRRVVDRCAAVNLERQAAHKHAKVSRIVAAACPVRPRRSPSPIDNNAFRARGSINAFTSFLCPSTPPWSPSPARAGSLPSRSPSPASSTGSDSIPLCSRSKAVLKHIGRAIGSLHRGSSLDGCRFSKASCETVPTLSPGTEICWEAFDIGIYTIVSHEAVPVNSSNSLDPRDEIDALDIGCIVNVLEIVPKLLDGRVRARIESPAGWISLCDIACAQQYAVSQAELVSCWVFVHQDSVLSGDGERVGAGARKLEPDDDEFGENDDRLEKADGELAEDHVKSEKTDDQDNANWDHHDKDSPGILLGTWQGERYRTLETYEVHETGGRWSCLRHGRRPKFFYLRWDSGSGKMLWGKKYFCDISDVVSNGTVVWYRWGRRDAAFVWSRCLE